MGHCSTRLYGYCALEVAQNFIFLYGCFPSKMINDDAKMVSQIVDTMVNRFDKNTLTLEVPHAFEHLKGMEQRGKKSNNIEMVVSSTLQPLRLYYAHNIATKKISYIFVNTECNGFKYRNA